MNNLSGSNKNKSNPLTRPELNIFIKDAQESNDWSAVENANVSKITDMAALFYEVKGIKDLDLSSLGYIKRLKYGVYVFIF